MIFIKFIHPLYIDLTLVFIYIFLIMIRILNSN